MQLAQPTVSISPCHNYSESTLRHSVEDLLESCGGKERLLHGKNRVLIKPNLLAPSEPSNAVTTHPNFVKVLTEILRETGTEVYVGDSPGSGTTESVARSCGILDAVVKAGAGLIPFEKAVELEFDEARVCRKFSVSQEALEMDLVINAAKLKTHALTGLSGAVKNCYGLIIGAQKKKLHARYPLVYDFAEMLLDLYLLTRPGFSIMDAVVAMEGPGPRSGRPAPLGVIAASENAVALDVVCAELTGFSTAEVSTLLAAQKRGLSGSSVKEITIKGPLEKLRDSSFDKGASGRGWSFLWRFFPAWTRNLQEKFRPWPVITNTCTNCGVCSLHCPTGIIYSDSSSQERNKPWIDYKQCLRCYCCQEICPHGAVLLKPRKPAGQ